MTKADFWSDLGTLQPQASERIEWPGGFSLEVRTFLTDMAPPSTLLTSARAIVFRGTEVLVVSDRTPSTHIIPGGRIEADEDPRHTVTREAGEETGWEVEPLVQVGLRHMRHLNPRPPGFTLPYPDFFQAVYVAIALSYRPELRETGGWEIEARFTTIEAAMAIALSHGEQALLAASSAILNTETYTGT